MDNRSTEIDVMRGLCMLCVILGHCISNIYNPVNQFILSFHMLAFYFISGMCYKKSDKPLSQIIFRKFQRLGWPWLTFSLLWIPISYIYVLVGLSPSPEIIKILVAVFWPDGIIGGDGPLGFWFVYDLLIISIFFPVFHKIFKNAFVIILLAIVAGVALYYCDTDFYQKSRITRLLLGVAFYGLGYKVWYLRPSLPPPIFIYFSLFACLCVTIWLSQNNRPVTLYNMLCGNIYYCLLTGFLGTLMLYGCSIIIKSNSILEHVGKNSIVYLFFHFHVRQIFFAIDHYLCLSEIAPVMWYGGMFLLVSMTCFYIADFVNQYVPWLSKLPSRYKSGCSC